jgi:hypothetical protein
MKVQELIEKLMTYNRNAEVQVTVDSYPNSFAILHGGSDGCTAATCDVVSFSVGENSEKEG